MACSQITRFAIRRAAARALISRISVPSQPRSITTLTAIVTRQTRSTILPLFQKRFASDDQSERHPAVVEEPAQPESQSAAEFDSSDVTPTEAKDVPQVDSAVENAVQSAASPDSGRFASRRSPRGRDGAAPPSKQLYIGNLFFDVTEEDLRREFSRFGTITNLRVIKDPRGMSKGYVEPAEITSRR